MRTPRSVERLALKSADGVGAWTGVRTVGGGLGWVPGWAGLGWGGWAPTGTAGSCGIGSPGSWAEVRNSECGRVSGRVGLVGGVLGREVNFGVEDQGRRGIHAPVVKI